MIHVSCSKFSVDEIIEYEKIEKAYYACKEADIEPPDEIVEYMKEYDEEFNITRVEDFFDDLEIDDRDEWGYPKFCDYNLSEPKSSWIKLDEIPKGVKTLFVEYDK